MVLYRVIRDVVPRLRLKRIATAKNPVNPKPVSRASKTEEMKFSIHKVDSREFQRVRRPDRKRIETVIHVADVKRKSWTILDLIKLPFYILKMVSAVFRSVIMGLLRPLRYLIQKVFLGIHYAIKAVFAMSWWFIVLLISPFRNVARTFFLRRKTMAKTQSVLSFLRPLIMLVNSIMIALRLYGGE